MDINGNYYEILGIDRNADEEAVKKAYRALAREYHPDRNAGDKEAEDKFKQIQEAYGVIGDKDKRFVYDSKTFVSTSSFQSNDFNDIFSSFFSQQQRQSNWGQNIELELVVDFLDAAKGCAKTVNIEKQEFCKTCNGTTAKDGKEFKTCVLCDGKGKTNHLHSGYGSFLKMESTCQSCKGTGKIISKFCPECASKGYENTSCTLELNIPAGIGNGMKICVRGEGDVGPNGPGNLYCVIRVKPHPVFQRDGLNLVVKLPVTYSQMVLGADLMVPCLDGECKFKVPPGTKSGATFRMSGLGFVSPNDEEDKGDLLVKVIVDVPDGDDLPDKYRDLLKQISEMEKNYPGNSRKNFHKSMEESSL